MLLDLALATLAVFFVYEGIANLALPEWARVPVVAALAFAALAAPALVVNALAVGGAAGLLRAGVAATSGGGFAMARLTRRTPDLPRR